jgi:hypothetical protein
MKAAASDLSNASFRALRISTSVRAGENDYRLGDDSIPNQIRKSVNDCSANVAMHTLIYERYRGKSID